MKPSLILAITITGIALSLARPEGKAVATPMPHSNLTVTVDRYSRLNLVKRDRLLEPFIVSAAVKYSVPLDAVVALLRVENSGDLDVGRRRFEPHLLAKFKPKAANPTEAEAMATSFGPFQVVYGWHKDRCGLKSYTELLDFEKNVECALSYYRECLDEVFRPGQSADENLIRAAACYNGDSTGTYARKFTVALQAARSHRA
jgi:hypothetical protein